MITVVAGIVQPWDSAFTRPSTPSAEVDVLRNKCLERAENSSTPDQSLDSAILYKDSPSSPHLLRSPCRPPKVKQGSLASSPSPWRSIDGAPGENKLDEGLHSAAGQIQSLPDPDFQPPRTPKICLCRTEAKIPRPRNAFILYRQHHAHSIHAQSPGITNPDVSKIAAGQWKDESIENRNYWNLLAQEEKELHQQQYPGYRYQPRRNGRKDSISEPSSASATNCDKCGGRVRIVPSTPSTANPFQRNRGSSLTTPTTASTSEHRRFPSMNNLSLTTPNRRDTKRHYPAPLHINGMTQDPNQAMQDPNSALSPDSKRRKFTVSGGWGPGRPTPNIGFVPGAPTPFRGSFAQPQPQQSAGFNGPQGWTPGPINLPRPSLVQLPPAQQQQLQQQMDQAQHQAQHQVHQVHQVQQQNQQQQQPRPDTSLTLPPIRALDRTAQQTNPIFRIVNLGKVAPALKKPPNTNLPFPVRGTAIALEGDTPAAASAVAIWLEDFLARSGDGQHAVQRVQGVEDPEPDRDITIPDYLEVIAGWHRRSHEMRAFLTTPIPSDINNSGGMQTDRSDDSATNGRSMSTSSTPSPMPGSPVPVLLIPQYQLHGACAWAARIPITDAYGPHDHWSWMATLWRGVLGADLTIYVKDEESGTTGLKGVEVNEAARVVVVRREKGKNDATLGVEGVGGIEEKNLRRLGFEVGEWVRGVAAAAAGVSDGGAGAGPGTGGPKTGA